MTMQRAESVGDSPPEVYRHLLGPLRRSCNTRSFYESAIKNSTRNQGTDHAWGGHHFVVGGAVHGGDFYGRYPTLVPDGPDDADSGSGARGRWIPTTAVDQYGATLASWYGVATADLPAVFPNLYRFDTANLGFV